MFKDIGLDPYFDGSYYQNYYQGANNTYRGDDNNTKLKMVNNVAGFIKGKKSENALDFVFINKIAGAISDFVQTNNGVIFLQ